ncbi:UPF0562 protein C7orf55 -like protein [Trichinella sp. T6]|nr:UPF0562 protein C7orf55 -like protein [Trichinella sp. T6]
MQTLRGIVFEWRKILKEPIRQTAAFQYLMKQYRKHQDAEREVCENAKQLKSLADTYLIYLQSTRMLKQLEDKYYYKTGITTEEAAAKVEYPAWFQNKWLLVLQFMNYSMACQRRLLDLSSLIICKSEQNGISESVDRIFP